jgi:hypothetical protein
MTRQRILIGILFVAALALLFMYSVQTHHPDNTVNGIGAGMGSASGPAAPRGSAAPRGPAAGAPCAASYSSKAFRRPHYAVYDATARPRTFGPAVAGRTTADVLAELQQRVCYDPALLVDIEGYLRHGLALPNPVARRNSIEALVTNWPAWDSRVSALMAGLRQVVTTKHLTGIYRSWWYQRGESPDVIPGLLVGEASVQASAYLTFQRPNGTRGYLRLECGFQPSG